MGRRLFPSSEHGQHFLGPRGPDVALYRRELFQLRARQLGERHVNLAKGDLEGAAHGPEFAVHEAAHFLTECLTMLLGPFHGAARIGIGIAGAADDKHNLGGRITLLHKGLCEAGIVAAELIVIAAERCAMDRGPEEHGACLALGGCHAQHGDGAIGEAAGIDAENDSRGSKFASVHDKMNHAAGPGKQCGLKPRRRFRHHLNDLVL